MNKYIIINSETIQKRIDELKLLYKNSEKPSIQGIIYKRLSKELETTLSNSKPLEKELSKAIESSIQNFESNAYEVPERIEEIKQDYINNLKLDI